MHHDFQFLREQTSARVNGEAPLYREETSEEEPQPFRRDVFAAVGS